MSHKKKAYSVNSFRVKPQTVDFNHYGTSKAYIGPESTSYTCGYDLSSGSSSTMKYEITPVSLSFSYNDYKKFEITNTNEIKVTNADLNVVNRKIITKDADIVNLEADNTDTNKLICNNGTIATLNATDGNITNGTIATLNATNGTIATLNATNGTVATLNATDGNITNSTISTLNTTNGNITNGTIATLNATNATVTNLTSNNSTIATLNATNGTVDTLTITNLSATDVTVTNETFSKKTVSEEIYVDQLYYRYWDRIYYNISDKNEKEDIRDLSEAESAVATKLKRMFKVFKYKDKKIDSDKNLLHCGIIAQDIQNAFKSEGLNPDNYGIVGSNQYFTDPEGKTCDKDGNYISSFGKKTDTVIKKNILTVNYNELLAFVISAM